MGSSNIANQKLKKQVLTQNFILSRMPLFSASESQYNCISKRTILQFLPDLCRRLFFVLTSAKKTNRIDSHQSIEILKLTGPQDSLPPIAFGLNRTPTEQVKVIKNINIQSIRFIQFMIVYDMTLRAKTF